ncbi:UNVERIFIED_CONTAM: hypothetical protein RMT77_008024 [Armadillidium vulgare]
MGQSVSRDDFEWSYNAQPHASRRIEILKKHPEIKTLFGHDPLLKYWVISLVVFQVFSLFFVQHLSWPTTILLSYVLGGVINHSLTLAIHEIGHNLAFGHARPLHNRIIGMIANLPICLPISIGFKIYHRDHHTYQGVDKLDPDLPTKVEASLFCTTFGKVVWMFLQPAFYIIRPLIVNPKPPTTLEVINTVVQLIFDALILYHFGVKCLVYLFGGAFLAMGLHPMAGHFISEHYMFQKGFETYSYYGPFNYLMFNVGYHNEHHDFPYIPFSRLPQVRKMAPEFYDNLPSHSSYMKVLYDFVMDPAIGPYARIKRKLVGLDKTD